MDFQRCSPLFHILLLPILFMKSCVSETQMYPFTCSEKIQSCSALLYQHNVYKVDNVASLYSVNASAIKPIPYADRQDYLVSVNCLCQNVDGTRGYFYDIVYEPKHGDTFYEVSNQNFSSQVWSSGVNTSLNVGENKTLHLLCGCVEIESQVVVTYTVQPTDTLSSIANLLAAQVDGIQKLNTYLKTPDFIKEGWLLYVPMEKYGLPSSEKGTKKAHKWILLIGILSAVTLLSVCTLAIILVGRKRRKAEKEDPKSSFKNSSSARAHSLQRQYTQKEITQDITVFESEKPSFFSIEEIAEATGDFDETRIIGRGGYGSVYHGVIGEKEVAIKKMRSNNSKEFLAEIKVLCKIHHNNVVELMGYATGDDHLYLVYVYIPNGSLSDRLHDPLMKGHQPLSWSARTQIALDAARGIEYIHDHTKSQYVHRDIKTTNILLDEGLRAKVADFGLAKLVGRSNEDEFIATQLVGTPGYLPPESVKEMQVTTKTDVFAFGVVLAELITGQRALIRDNQEPNKMKSLITVVNNIFNEEDAASALQVLVDGNLKDNYPREDVYKMGEIAQWCLSEEAVDRPEMREVVIALARIRMSSIVGGITWREQPNFQWKMRTISRLHDL